MSTPFLLSYYAFSNGGTTRILGQLAGSSLRDLSFLQYNRRKTFRTIFKLYRSRTYPDAQVHLKVGQMLLSTRTNAFGFFHLETNAIHEGDRLQRVFLEDGDEVMIPPDLFPHTTQLISSPMLIVSDIDDTLVHSFITRRFRKVKTMLFTTMEKRKAVTNMFDLIHWFCKQGAHPIYLSNSEQNLYPLIYRFLRHNRFPDGPLFLKQIRSVWDVIWNIKFPIRHLHKFHVLEDLLNYFPDKKLILVGDNTQSDLPVYLSIAERHPGRVLYIIIRKVRPNPDDEPRIARALSRMQVPVKVMYDENFPSVFEL